jgi:2',3'-cyclic-nucleotide 2'-phosphodiesterase (5'-nucleotidase family)
MNKMRYDAATIGNHDFDGGIETLVNKLRELIFHL